MFSKGNKNEDQTDTDDDDDDDFIKSSKLRSTPIGVDDVYSGTLCIKMGKKSSRTLHYAKQSKLEYNGCGMNPEARETAIDNKKIYNDKLITRI